MTSNDNPIICYCLRRRLTEVEDAWKKGDFKSAEDFRAFMEATKMGTVCTACRSTLKNLVETKLAAGIQTPTSARAPLPQIYNTRNRKLSPWKRFKRILRRARDRSVGMRILSFHTFYRYDADYQTAFVIANVSNPDFQGAAVDLAGRVRAWDERGRLWHDAEHDLPREKTITIDLEKLERGDTNPRFGLLQIDLRPRRTSDARRWKIGSLRPYVTFQKNGLSATVHEKSLRFETPRVLPGIVGNPVQNTVIALANIDDVAGTVTADVRAARGAVAHTLEFEARAALLYTIPETVSGALVTEISFTSTIGLTGYQFAENKTSGLFSVQHIVREGGK